MKRIRIFSLTKICLQLCMLIVLAQSNTQAQTLHANDIVSNRNDTALELSLTTKRKISQLYKFGSLNIKITQSDVDLKKTKKGLLVDSFLTAQVSVDKNGTSIDILSFDHMQDMGYVAGLFIPKPQPLTNYFLIVKHGDYDGRLLLIDKNGKIANISGGGYFITPDKRYLFSDWEEDSRGTGFTVFDLLKHRVIYKTSTKDHAHFDNIDQWYKDNYGYFFTARNYNDDGQTTDDNYILAYKFDSNKLFREPAKDRLKNAEKIQFNFVDDKKSAVLIP